MKALILILMLGSLLGENLPPQLAIDKMTSSDKMTLYIIEKKSPAIGVMLSSLMPTAGHLYTAKWRRGLILAVPQVGLLVMGILTPSHDTKTIEIAYSGSAVFKILELVDARNQVKKYNRNLYKSIFGNELPSIGLTLQPTYKGANLTMFLSFD